MVKCPSCSTPTLRQKFNYPYMPDHCGKCRLSDYKALYEAELDEHGNLSVPARKPAPHKLFRVERRYRQRLKATDFEDQLSVRPPEKSVENVRPVKPDFKIHLSA